MKNIWFNSEIRSLIYQRDYLHHLATKNRNNLTWSHYKSFRNHVATKIRLAKKEYYTNEIKLIRQNPSDMWKIINNFLPSKSTSTSDLDLNPDLFNDFFLPTLAQILQETLPPSLYHLHLLLIPMTIQIMPLLT